MEDKTSTAEVYGKSLPISTKISVEICDAIRGEGLTKAKSFLNEIVLMKRPLALKKFNRERPHKRGNIAAGRYPIKTGREFLRLLDSAGSNAENKGLDINNLVVKFAKADRAERRWRTGRKGRMVMKSTHVRIIVEERKE